jgi:hypothetical protein
MPKAHQTLASSKPGGGDAARTAQPAAALADLDGPIPEFPPRAVDERGRLIPLSAEERRARSEAVLRTLAALRDLSDDDSPDTLERLMTGLDAHRPPDRRLFKVTS